MSLLLVVHFPLQSRHILWSLLLGRPSPRGPCRGPRGALVGGPVAAGRRPSWEAAPAGRPLEAAMTQPLPFLLVVLTLLLHSPLHSSTLAISPHTLHSLPLTNFFYSCFIMLTHASISTNRRALNCLINYNSNFFFTKNVCTYMFHS